MRGRLLFYLPGIPGAGLIALPTGSKHFGAESESVLRDIMRLGNGHLPTLVDGRPVLERGVNAFTGGRMVALLFGSSVTVLAISSPAPVSAKG